MSLSELGVGGLYITLYVRHHPPVKNNSHWGLYHHEDDKARGTEYHVKGIGQGWIANHGKSPRLHQSRYASTRILYTTKPETHYFIKQNGVRIFSGFLFVGLMQITSIPEDLKGYGVKKLRTYDNEINDREGITCRVWLFDVLKLLQTPVDGVRILECENLGDLEQEAMDLGKKHAQAAADNIQPRPINLSQFLLKAEPTSGI
ncbi:hypothetical protein BU24DRAFT_490943 [Aaosphaeria arxii CBS 175.79]|uniref:Uncharacterized protein n=1 Tax=Aaosphaeria arxii CBS 175.79 TaxID=1450172 RepID=A0A6A5XYS8_9PLEO|nr:uncharacterized protein BU24DRAFT_490943 [Aaosphaeria arxii CBS 175.79]KAF2017861.1 hypothetical protein BU24DRAFT_490943 [Aaosphaeria arxii CBS 175.79]